MVVLTMMGILISIAAPSFRRALEQSRFDLAAANLRSIWSAERLYWLENHAYTDKLSVLADPKDGGLIDPSICVGTQFYTYAITITSADGTMYTATATRINSTLWNGTITIDQTGTLSGQLQAPGESPIKPISQ